MRQRVQLQPEFTPSAAATAGPYSQAMRAGELIAISGQVAMTPDGEAVPEGFAQQLTLVFANLRAILDHLGLTPADVIKTTCFLVDVSHRAEFNAGYAEFFGDHLPARSTIGVALGGGFLVEIEAWALSR